MPFQCYIKGIVEKQVIYLEFLDSYTLMLKKKKKLHICITYNKRGVT